jgi:hypothetical protein
MHSLPYIDFGSDGTNSRRNGDCGTKGSRQRGDLWVSTTEGYPGEKARAQAAFVAIRLLECEGIA